MREVIPVNSIRVVEGTLQVSVNQPLEAFWGPIDSIGVELVGWSCNIGVSCAVVACGVVFAKVVGFDFVVESANSFL